jgi:PPOX class probable F420-dependent enzyme
MPSRRDQIRMSHEELRAFLGEHMIVSCATIGPRGRPHLVSLWYLASGVELRGWTYAKSQKARNLERDAHATLLVEDGVQYHELRGAMLECDVDLERDTGRVAERGMELFERYAGGELDQQTREAVERQAPKRVGLTFHPTRIVTWDHSKLGGSY